MQNSLRTAISCYEGAYSQLYDEDIVKSVEALESNLVLTVHSIYDAVTAGIPRGSELFGNIDIEPLLNNVRALCLYAQEAESTEDLLRRIGDVIYSITDGSYSNPKTAVPVSRLIMSNAGYAESTLFDNLFLYREQDLDSIGPEYVHNLLFHNMLVNLKEIKKYSDMVYINIWEFREKHLFDSLFNTPGTCLCVDGERIIWLCNYTKVKEMLKGLNIDYKVKEIL